LSDSDAYTVWTAEMGALIVGSEDRKVSKQPYSGAFFKSQNASTWTESPFMDLMFRVNKATWTGTSTAPQQGKLVTRGVPPAGNTTFDSFEFFPHDVNFADVTFATYILDILPYNPTNNNADGSVAVRYDGFPNQGQPAYVRSFLQGYGANSSTRNIPDWSTSILGTANTVDGQIILSTWSTDVAPYVDFKKSNMVCIQHRINELGIELDAVVVSDPGKGYLVQNQAGYVSTTAACTEVTGVSTSFQSTLRTGDTIIVGGNLEVVVSAVNTDTSLVATAVVSESRSSNSWFTYGTANDDNKIALTISGGNGVDASGYAVIDPDGTINAIEITSEGYGYTETPTITIGVPGAVGGFSATLQANASITYASEVGSQNTLEATRYITRAVTLADGFEARDIKVYFDAYRPETTDFYVYYRVLPVSAGESARFGDQPWRLMTMVTDDAVVSPKWDSYKEFQFKTPNGKALDAEGDTTDKFKVFAIKIVPSSSSTVDVPRIMNFRAIALDA